MIIFVILAGSIIYYNYGKKQTTQDDDLPKKECKDFSMFAYDSSIIAIKIALPVDYDNSQNLPSIYLLDANYFFSESGTLDHLLDRRDGMTAITSRLMTNQDIPSSILIGIGYSENQRNKFMIDDVESFYGFLKNQLIQEVEARCKVSKSPRDRVLYGYSGSAHFTSYALVKDVNDGIHTFDNFISVAAAYFQIIGSGSNKVYGQLDEIFQNKGVDAFSNRSLYLAVGTDDGLYNESLNFANTLQNQSYQHFNFKYEEYEGFTHSNIPELAYENGMKWIYSSS